MLRSVLLKTLRDVRRGFLWWSLGLAAMVALMVSVYPSIRENPALNKLVENYPEAFKGFIGFGGELDYSSAPGYLGVELFSFMVPLLLLIAAVAAGSNAIAGEEERGTLDLLLSLPLSRRRVALEKLGALVLEVVGLGFVLWISLWAGVRAVGMDISAVRLGGATASAVLLAIAYGAIALMVGAATGKRSWAVGVAAAAAVGAYLVNSLAPLVDVLETAQRISPFYYYSAVNPLRHGLVPGHVAVLLGIAIVAAAISLPALSRRDLSG